MIYGLWISRNWSYLKEIPVLGIVLLAICMWLFYNALLDEFTDVNVEKQWPQSLWWFTSSFQVQFSEPLSFLQRITDELFYADILTKAATCESSLEQAALVAAFACSHYESTAYRLNKPFNPMLGETYECDRRAELGWRCLFEQVSYEEGHCCGLLTRGKAMSILYPPLVCLYSVFFFFLFLYTVRSSLCHMPSSHTSRCDSNFASSIKKFVPDN